MRLTLARRARTLPLVVVAVLAGSCKDSTIADNPTPGIDLISPDELLQGGADQTLTIRGSDFIGESQVLLDGSARPTDYVSRAELRATVTAADLTTSDVVEVTVLNPPPGGGTSNAAQLRIDPRPTSAPVATSVSPEFLFAGAGETLLTIKGSGFVAESRVWVNFVDTPATYVAPDELTVKLSAPILAVAGAVNIQVVNPPPGGGVSSTLQVEIRNPAPAIASIGTEEAIAGVPLTLELTGSGFTAASEVLLSGAIIPSTYVNATRLEVPLGEDALRTTGTLEIAVRNPPPGGGRSSSVSLRVVAAPPEITLLPSSGATTGRPGFSLTVHGRGFVEASTIHWNGQQRTTQYISSTRLVAAITSADVASAGTATITVETPPPGGGTSNPMNFVVSSLPAMTLTETHRVPLDAADVVYSKAEGLLYASVRSGASPLANTITAIDPVTGEIVESVFVGSSPAQLALSSDGRVLYAGLNGASSVRRVDLDPFTAGVQWSVGPERVAGDLAVVPGESETVVVSIHHPGYSPSLEAVTVYDDGIARPVSGPGHTGGSRIEFLESGSEFYGYNNLHTGFELFTISLDQDGARHVRSVGEVFTGFSTDIVGTAGRLYGTDGTVVDPGPATRVGTFPVQGAVAVDPERGRAFVRWDGDIHVVDLNTFQLLGTVNVPEVVFDGYDWVSIRLVRWGTDGIAFLDSNELFIVRSPAFGQ